MQRTHKYIRVTPIERFLILRRRNRWTAVEAAQQLGIKVRTLRSWEQGRAEPHPGNAAKLEAFLHTALG